MFARFAYVFEDKVKNGPNLGVYKIIDPQNA